MISFLMVILLWQDYDFHELYQTSMYFNSRFGLLDTYMAEEHAGLDWMLLVISSFRVLKSSDSEDSAMKIAISFILEYLNLSFL